MNVKFDLGRFVSTADLALGKTTNFHTQKMLTSYFLKTKLGPEQFLEHTGFLCYNETANFKIFLQKNISKINK